MRIQIVILLPKLHRANRLGQMRKALCVCSEANVSNSILKPLSWKMFSMNDRLLLPTARSADQTASRLLKRKKASPPGYSKIMFVTPPSPPCNSCGVFRHVIDKLHCVIISKLPLICKDNEVYSGDYSHHHHGSCLFSSSRAISFSCSAVRDCCSVGIFNGRLSRVSRMPFPSVFRPNQFLSPVSAYHEVAYNAFIFVLPPPVQTYDHSLFPSSLLISHCLFLLLFLLSSTF